MAYLIAVDSGHGMETAGKRTPVLPDNWLTKKKGDIIHEKEFNKPAAEYLIQALMRCGFKTINVSPGTIDIPLKDRYTTANDAKADAFISKHYNAYKGVWGSANGIETIVSQYANSSTTQLANFVQDELVKTHKRTDRGVKTDIKQSGINIAVLHNATMPAILTESGFMDNLEEAKTMIDPKFQKADAEATCRGICKYFGVTYIEEFKMPTKSITKGSSKEDIKWLQDRLNKALPDESNIPLMIDGIYGNKTRIAVLIYWEKLRWNKDGTGDGWRAGAKTINSLL